MDVFSALSFGKGFQLHGGIAAELLESLGDLTECRVVGLGISTAANQTSQQQSGE